MDSLDKANEILNYWFGHVEGTSTPSEHRTWIWFSNDKEVEEEIKSKFLTVFNEAIEGKYIAWEDNPRTCLALIILFDQFSRYIYRDHAQAFVYDQKALDLCLQGIERQFDHQLSLIERVFFYFPLMHAENIEMQSLSMRAYQMLLNLSFPETKIIFEKFLDSAIQQYEVINRFGRFPQRNIILGRPSTPGELEFLKNTGIIPEV